MAELGEGTVVPAEMMMEDFGINLRLGEAIAFAGQRSHLSAERTRLREEHEAQIARAQQNLTAGIAALNEQEDNLDQSAVRLGQLLFGDAIEALEVGSEYDEVVVYIGGLVSFERRPGGKMLTANFDFETAQRNLDIFRQIKPGERVLKARYEINNSGQPVHIDLEKGGRVESNPLLSLADSQFLRDELMIEIPLTSGESFKGPVRLLKQLAIGEEALKLVAAWADDILQADCWEKATTDYFAEDLKALLVAKNLDYDTTVLDLSPLHHKAVALAVQKLEFGQFERNAKHNELLYYLRQTGEMFFETALKSLITNLDWYEDRYRIPLEFAVARADNPDFDRLAYGGPESRQALAEAALKIAQLRLAAAQSEIETEY